MGRGFTLIEMLVVLTLMGLILAMTLERTSQEEAAATAAAFATHVEQVRRGIVTAYDGDVDYRGLGNEEAVGRDAVPRAWLQSDGTVIHDYGAGVRLRPWEFAGVPAGGFRIVTRAVLGEGCVSVIKAARLGFEEIRVNGEWVQRQGRYRGTDVLADACRDGGNRIVWFAK